MTDTAWQRYVRTLCSRAWDLDDLTTEELVERIAVLVDAGEVTDTAIAELLFRAGVTESSVDLIARTIRVAITA